ncbi:MAG TPA: sugar phosphate nucleotidyltransferase, partial [Caldilineaceae bacterium]|nr:sugar phosphate nucleotidyltransferase [Caldilineaceae bacterium]
MKITKAVLTVAGRQQRTLPLQTLIDRDGVERSVLHILLNEVVQAGIEEIAVVVRPGDETAYAEVAGDHAGRLHFVQQADPLGYGHAIYCARRFTQGDPFLHLVGDHLYVQRDAQSCAQRLVEVAQAEECTVSAVQATRESLLPYYGVVGGRRVPGHPHLYRVDTVVEKPTPTEAEQRLLVPGLRAGHYLCFFGMHVLTPTVMEILERQLAAQPAGNGNRAMAPVTLSSALAELAPREQYLALEQQNARYDLGVKYGLFTAQLALAL